MSDLCYKCAEWIKPGQIVSGYVHCHHEPKEKPQQPKCWCDLEANLIMALNFTVTILGKEEQIIFCPKCGKKL